MDVGIRECIDKYTLAFGDICGNWLQQQEKYLVIIFINNNVFNETISFSFENDILSIIFISMREFKEFASSLS